MRIAPEIGMAIQNAMAVEDKERQFHSILQVLASSIDARDPLTAGHSDRVTQFAVGIAREMGLSQATIEMVRVSALLHDYGKIGIADSILKKPGKLTDQEYDEIKTHAAKTKQILDKIEFQGIYREVPNVASSHHEKFDGTGYPTGLKGTGYTSRRPDSRGGRRIRSPHGTETYRKPMHLNDAFEILQQDKGKHFDPEAVDAFTRFYEREGKVIDASLQAAVQEDPGYVNGQEQTRADGEVLEGRRKRGRVVISLNSGRT